MRNVNNREEIVNKLSMYTQQYSHCDFHKIKEKQHWVGNSSPMSVKCTSIGMSYDVIAPIVYKACIKNNVGYYRKIEERIVKDFKKIGVYDELVRASEEAMQEVNNILNVVSDSLGDLYSISGIILNSALIDGKPLQVGNSIKIVTDDKDFAHSLSECKKYDDKYLMSIEMRKLIYLNRKSIFGCYEEQHHCEQVSCYHNDSSMMIAKAMIRSIHYSGLRGEILAELETKIMQECLKIRKKFFKHSIGIVGNIGVIEAMIDIYVKKQEALTYARKVKKGF
jgi:hypothetical protein